MEDTKIFINGKEKEVNAKELSFANLVKLAFPNLPGGDDVRFTVIFRDGPPENPEGSLNPGQSVKIKKGMIFDVSPTTQS